MARHADSSGGCRLCSPCKRGSAHDWQQNHAGELLSGEPYYPELVGHGPLAVQTLLKLAGDRRLERV